MAAWFPLGAASWRAALLLLVPPKGPTLSPGWAGWLASRQERAHQLVGRVCPAWAAADSCGAPAGGGSLQRRRPAGRGGGGGLGPRPTGGRC